MLNYATFDPDELKGKADDARSTIFIDGKLFVDPQTGRAHRSLYIHGKGKKYDWLRARLAPEIDHNVYSDKWFQLYSKYLFGRIGHVPDPDSGQLVSLASFWGRGADYDRPDAKGPTDQIPACVQQLYYNELVDDDTVVVYGDGRYCTAGELLLGQGPEPARADPEAARKIELAKRMHLARGQEKQDIMKQLGVGGGGSDKVEPWDRSLRDRGLLAPGHQHWRMHSESQQRRLDEALLLLEKPADQPCPRCEQVIGDWHAEWAPDQPGLYRGTSAIDCPLCGAPVLIPGLMRVAAVAPEGTTVSRRSWTRANLWANTFAAPIDLNDYFSKFPGDQYQNYRFDQ